MNFLTILVAFSLCFIPLASQAKCDKEGADIMKAQEEAQSAKTEEESQQIVILDVTSNKKEERQLKRFSSKKDSKNTKSVLYFNEPATIKGAGLLSWKESGEENQWLYVPELKKLQRIASGSRKNYFMGTDFTYADLEGENLDKNKYTCTGEVSCQKDKSKCYVIEAKPINEAEARNIGYSKRMLLVDKKDLINLKIVFYDLRGKKLKTADYANWTQIGKLWRPNLAIMDRHDVQKTFIKVGKRQLNRPIDDIVFAKRYLQKEMHIK
jgi:outer membrane lipoprotein-sorting protein